MYKITGRLAYLQQRLPDTKIIQKRKCWTKKTSKSRRNEHEDTGTKHNMKWDRLNHTTNNQNSYAKNTARYAFQMLRKCLRMVLKTRRPTMSKNDSNMFCII